MVDVMLDEEYFFGGFFDVDDERFNIGNMENVFFFEVIYKLFI